jgi:alpha-ketoglutarate-dependent taurine dioxygenase
MNPGHPTAVTMTTLETEGSLPLMVRPRAEKVDLAGWLEAQRHLVDRELGRWGALLFRGFAIGGPESFEAVAARLCDILFAEDGEHPRLAPGANVYHPTFYPPDQRLLWHNENSFDHRWPGKIVFGCLRPADEGGETTLVDGRRLYAALDREVRDAFVARAVTYVRNYDGGLGFDWRAAFATASRAEVESRCREQGMECRWREGDRLQIRSIRPAALRHPRTGEPVWFSQAQHWHLSCFAEATREAMLALYESPDDMPWSCRFGDGSPIPDRYMEEVLRAYQALDVPVRWQAGDVLLVDNILVAHGRNPFRGERRLLIALGDLKSYLEVEAVTLP